MFYVYFAKSLKNGKIYTGKTSKKPEERIEEHNTGCNDWSRNNGPFELIYFEEYSCSQDATKRELFYKSGFGRKIRDILIKNLDTGP
jgi:predicted GIY-YIG superfamily endonuclease